MNSIFSLLLIISLFPRRSLSGNCVESDDGCLQCDTVKDICLKCVTHRYPNGAYCDKCDAKCKECTILGHNCIDCYDGFYLKDNTCIKCEDNLCNKCIYDTKYQCTECQSGYSVYSDDGLCKQCHPSCDKCNGPESTQCTSCQNGFFNPTSGDSSQSFSCTTCATHCKKCHGQDISECDECSDGFYKSGNQCLSCDSQCRTCEETKTKCTSCHPGFYINGNECSECSENCVTCEGPEAWQCTTCAEGYMIYGGICQTCSYATGVQGCPRCKRNQREDAKCLECPPGYNQAEDYDGDDETFTCTPCTSNCLSCPVFERVCTECEDQYYIDENSYCSHCEEPCLTCEGSATSCTSCVEGYILNKESNTCENCPENCLYCSSKTFCNTCNNTYYPVDGVCTPCHKSCELCHDDSNSCDECREKYYFNQDKQCVDCPANCNRCNSTHCIICDKDFYPVDGVCTPCADVCSHCTGPTVDDCIECDPGFYFSESFSACYKCDDSCSTCEYRADSCTSCATGYYPGEWGGCYKCEMNCKECNSYSNCSKCNDGFRLYLREGETEPDCQPCKNRGCKNCDSDANQCSQCIDGYYSTSKDENNFLNCQPCPQGCSKCSVESGQLKCTDCIDEFYLQNGVCNKCSVPCATCSNQNTCITCVEGFLFDGISSCNKKCSSDCLTCENTPNTCTSCHTGYVLAGSRCIQCSEGCRTCETSYWSENNRCTSCNDGYYLEYENCVKCSDNCATCKRGSSDSCTSCKPGFYFASAKIQPNSAYSGECSPCSGEGHENCELCIENCNEDDSTCSQIPICTKCKAGYYVTDSNECDKCADYCAVCDGPNADQCIQCQNGYYFFNNQCSECSPNCATCDTDPEVCTSCEPGKYLKNNKCESCDSSKCAECVNEQGYCTKCAENKFVYEGNCYSSCNDVNEILGTNETSNECYKCILLENCAQYDNSCQCSSCKEGYYLSGQNCQKCPIGCTTCSSFTECNGCIDGYFLNDKVCDKCQEGCESCKDTAENCLSCFTGYYHEGTNNSCIHCDPSCFNCSGPGSNNCLACNNGYIMNDNGVCERVAVGCDGKRCELVNDDVTKIENYTIDATLIPTFNEASNKESGGALRLLNYGLAASDVTFTKCSSENGGGGGIFVYNKIESKETSYSISLTKLTFIKCKAQYGAAVFIYSPSETIPVHIENCYFESNELTSSDGKLSGGSALYLTAKLSEVIGCSFIKNKGRGGSVKINDNLDITPDKLQILQKRSNHSTVSVLISGCSFIIDENSDCSLFYENERQSTKVEINDCSFKGKLANKAHFIDGKSFVNEKPNLYIKSCMFNTDQNGALNEKFIKIDLNNQLSSNNKIIKIQLSSKMLTILSTLAIVAVIAILVLIKTRNQDIEESENESQVSIEA